MNFKTGAAGLVVTEYFPVWQEAKELVFLLFFSLAFLGVLIGIFIYRCPNCGKVPNEDGVPWDPTFCPYYGVPLK